MFPAPQTPTPTPPPASTSSYSDTPPGSQPTQPGGPYLGTWSGPISGEFYVDSRGWDVASYSGTLSISIGSATLIPYYQDATVQEAAISSGTIVFQYADQKIAIPINSLYSYESYPNPSSGESKYMGIYITGSYSFLYNGIQETDMIGLVGGSQSGNISSISINNWNIFIFDSNYLNNTGAFSGGNVYDQGYVPSGYTSPLVLNES